MYYLQSRYYSPAIGRFISADNIGLIGVNGDIAAYNLFVYCGNNAVSRTDSSGQWWNVAIGAVIGGSVSAVTTMLDGGSGNEIIVSAICGAVSGAISATGFGGIAGQVAIGAVTTAIDSGFQNFNKCVAGEKTIGQALGSTVIDTTMGALFGAMGFEGSDPLRRSNEIAGNVSNAIRKLSEKVVHPKVKSNSKAILRQGVRYIKNEFRDNLFNSVTQSAIQYGTGKVAELYY